MTNYETEGDERSFQDKARCSEVLVGVELSDEELERSAAFYEKFRMAHDGPVKVGLYGEDLRHAMQDPNTIVAQYRLETEVKPVSMPLLVPISDLEWYNLPYLHEQYGEDTEIYCYVHPPIPKDEASAERIMDAMRTVLDSGAVVLFDQYQGDPPFEWEVTNVSEDGTISRVMSDDHEYELETMSSNGRPKKADIFVCPVDVYGIETVHEAPSIHEAYKDAIARGIIEVDSQNGPSIEQAMSEQDMQKIWEIYEKPFERLSKGTPVLAGFDEESLREMLSDPDIVKVINRQEGEITTLLFFTQNFDQYPWFNKEHFQKLYPEYFNTGNILLCPGIVSDESLRGAAFSWSLVDLLARTLAHRGSNIMLSFECTEISTRYIPTKVVARGVEASGVGVVRHYEQPEVTVEYKVLRKNT